MKIRKVLLRFLRNAREDIFSKKLTWYERLNKIWDYFKRGNGEIRNFLAIWNLILLFAINLNFKLSMTIVLVWTVMFIPVCVLIGLFFTKKVNIAAAKTSPFTQDNILSAIRLQQSLINLYEYQKTGDTELLDQAIDEMNAAQRLREKWVDLCVS